MPKNDTLARVGDAQLEAFERKRQRSQLPPTSFSLASTSPESSFTNSTTSSSFTSESNEESLKTKVPLIPPPTALFPNPGKESSNLVLPVSPVSPPPPPSSLPIPPYVSDITALPLLKEPTPPSPSPSLNTSFTPSSFHSEPSMENKESSSSSSSSTTTTTTNTNPTKPCTPSPIEPNITNDALKQGEKKTKGLPPFLTKDSSSTLPLPLQPLPSSPNSNPSLGSMLLMNGQQKVHLIETQFRLLTQSFKEKVAQPLFGTETRVTRFQDAEEAHVALEQLQSFYVQLHDLVMNYHRSLHQVMEYESDLARMMLEWGYKSPPESEIGSSLVTCGTAYQAQSNSFATYVKSISNFRDQLKAFLHHALKDAQETRKKQEEIRKEWDAAHLKLLPSLKLPHLENDKFVSWIPGLAASATASMDSTNTTTTTLNSSPTTNLFTKPFISGTQERKKSANVVMSTLSNNMNNNHNTNTNTNPNHSTPPSTLSQEIKPEEVSPVTQLGQKLTDVTTGFVQKCAILQQKSSSDLTQQLWSIRKQSALYHSSALDSMMMSSGTSSTTTTVTDKE